MRSYTSITILTVSLAAIVVFGACVILQPVYTLGVGMLLEEDGYHVYRVVPGSRGARAGMVPGDVIEAIDGVPVEEVYRRLNQSTRSYLQHTTALFPPQSAITLQRRGQPAVVLPTHQAPLVVRLRAADGVVLFNILAGFLLTLSGGILAVQGFRTVRHSREILAANRRYFVFVLFAGPAVATSYFHSLWSWEFLQGRFVFLTIAATGAVIALVSFGTVFPKRIPRGRVALLAAFGVPPAVYLALSLARRIHLVGPAHFALHGYLLAGMVVFLALLRTQYRHNDAGGRRRLRWVLLGAAASVTPFTAYIMGIIFRGTFVEQQYSGVFVQISMFFLLLLPVSMGMGITRFDYLDIDDIVSRMATHAILGIPLVALAGVFLNLTVATDMRVFYIIFLVAIIVSGVMAEPVVRRWVTRRVHGRRNHAAETVARLMEHLAVLTSEEEIRNTVVQGLREAYQPVEVDWFTEPSQECRNDPYHMTAPLSPGGGNQQSHMLYLGQRSDGDIYTAADRHLLQNLARALERRLIALAYHHHTTRAMEQERALMADKDELLQEVQHRVKNNLQVMVSLLSLQMQRSTSREVREELERTQRRIYSMALVHESSYQDTDLGHIRAGLYLGSIIAALYRPGPETAPPWRIDTNIEDVLIPVSLALPCGMILAELFTNALHHGCPPAEECRVAVSFRYHSDGQVLRLAVDDPGNGLADPGVLHSGQSGGFMVAQAMASQIRGSLAAETPRDGGGSRVTLTVPVQPHQIRGPNHAGGTSGAVASGVMVSG